MYEKETQFIIDFNLNKIKNLGSSFTLEKLSDLDLHPAIIKYISGELDSLIYEDRKVLLENSLFNYSGIKVSEYFNQISKEIKKTLKLPVDKVGASIKNAVAFNIDYIIYPTTALTNLVYSNTDISKNVSEIRIYLNYIYYYDYLVNILNSYISKKRFTSFNRNEFETVINKINNEVLSLKKEEVIGDAIDTIADFFNDGAVDKISIPVKLVDAYLKGDNFNEYQTKLEKIFMSSKKKMDNNELKDVLFSPSVAPDVLEKMEAEPEDKKKSEVEIEFEEEYVDNRKEEDEIVLESIKENKTEQDSIIEEEIIDDEEVNNTVPKDSDKRTNDVKIPEQKTTKFKKDLFIFLHKKDIEKIVDAVFNDDRDDFTNTMEKIAECKNYDQASEILKTVFYTYRIDPYIKEAVTLTNAVSNYFDQAG